MKNWARFLTWASVFAAVIGTAIWNREFSTLRLGPLYILDVLFLIWALINLRNFKLEIISRPIFIFFAWGTILLLLGLTRGLTSSRTIQHAILFVYPLVWSLVGWVSYRDSEKWTQALMCSLIGASVIQGLTGTIRAGEAVVGALGILAAVHLLALPNVRLKIFGAIFLFTTFFPFWNSWTTNMQRTSLLGLFIMALLATIAVKRFLLGSLIVSIFVAGLFTVSQMRQMSMNDSFYQSMQHDEDRPYAKAHENFQFRSRKIFWNRALEQWKRGPISGIGFADEVPDLTRDEYVAVYGHAFPVPLSGPHNSYLTILARMGIVGLLLYLFIVGEWLLNAVSLWRRPNLFEWTVLSVFMNGSLYALFNVGLESPHNCVAMWFCYGVTLSYAKKYRDHKTGL